MKTLKENYMNLEALFALPIKEYMVARLEKFKERAVTNPCLQRLIDEDSDGMDLLSDLWRREYFKHKYGDKDIQQFLEEAGDVKI